MGGDENNTPSIDDLTLEPIESDQPFATQTAEQEADIKAKFKLDTRDKTERRKTADRRKLVRFESDRRSGNDRRPENNSWKNH